MGAQSKFHKVIGAVEVVVGAILDWYGQTYWGNSLILLGVATWNGVPGAPRPQASALRANLASPITPMQIVYGKTRVGGVLVACDSGDGAGDTDADYKYYAVALSLTLQVNATTALAIEGLDANGFWYIDNNRIDDACVDHTTGVISGSSGVGNLINYDTTTQLLLHKGNQTTVDSWLTAGLSYWTSAYVGHGIAYLVCKIHADPTSDDTQAAFPNGLPQQINVVIKGQKVYDPRLDGTAGGSGTHRKNDPTTWEYTHAGVDIGANPALCLRDYLVRPVSEGGAGIDYTAIPDDYLTAAANACDVSMTVPNGSGGTTTVPTYQVGVGLSTSDGVPSNIQKLLDAMGGMLVETAGEFRIIAGIYTAPVTTINEDWLCGPPNLQVQAEQDTRWNTVDATFTDPSADYTEVQTPTFSASGAVTADGGIVLPKHLNLPAVPNQYQAQNICSISANQSREQQTLTLPCNLKAMDLDCGEFVNVTIGEYGLSNAKFRILNWQRKGDSSILLNLQQAKSTTFNPPTFIEVAPLGHPFIDNYPPTVQNPTATATDNGIRLDWDPVPAGMIVGYNIYRATSSGGTYSLVKKTASNHWTDTDVSGGTWFYKLKARNYRGNLSKSYSSIVSAKAKVVADGADVTANQLAGFGVNLQALAYSLFGINSLTPTFAGTHSHVTPAAGNTGIYGYDALNLTFDGSGAPDLILTSSVVGNPTLHLKKLKYLISLYLDKNTSDNNAYNLSVAFRDTTNTDAFTTGTLTARSDHSANTAGVYQGVLDMTSATVLDGSLHLVWGATPAAGTARLQGVMVEQQRGTLTEASDYVIPGQGTPDASGVTLGFYGSMPPIIPDMTFTFNRNTTSINISWSSFTIRRPDVSTTSVGSGSQNVTGLSSGTSYVFYPYYDETAGTVNFVSGGSSVGSPAIMNTTTSGTLAASQTRLFRLPLSISGVPVSTTTSGTSGGSGGGTSNCLHPEQPVLVLRGDDLKLLAAAEVQSGDKVWDGERWVPVLRVWTEPESEFVEVMFDSGETLRCTDIEPVYHPDGEYSFAKRLNVGMIVEGRERPLLVEGVRRLRDAREKVCIELDSQDRTFYITAAGPKVHNTVYKP